MSGGHDTPVLIAGGGPVGITLAMDLAWRGVRSTVLEPRLDMPPSPRCNTTNARSMEVFRRLGCADAIRAAGLPATHCTDVVYMTAMNGEEITRFRRPTTQEWRDGTPVGIGADWPTPEPQHFISQLYMEPPLREHAVKHHGVDLRLGQALQSFTQDADGVTAEVLDHATGRTTRLRAAHLVGADGSNSLVRRDIGARLEGISRLADNVTTFVRAPRLSALAGRHPGWMYRFIGGGVLVAIDGHDGWLLHAVVPPGAELATYDPRPAWFAAVGEAFEHEVINEARWTARAMVCNKYREGRVFLAGDAAHLWIPMGGFGMNSGVADAAALGWLLAGVHQGWMDPKALDAYEAERSGVGATVAAQAARWGRDLGTLLRVDPARRDELRHSAEARRAHDALVRGLNTSEWDSVGMMLGVACPASPLVVPDAQPAPAFDVSRYEESSAPGVRAPHVWLDPARRVSLHDRLGKGFTLLRLCAQPPGGAALVALAAARDVPLQVLDLDQPAVLAKYLGGEMAGAGEVNGKPPHHAPNGLVLVRPDQHIAWRSRGDPSEAEARAVLDRVTGRSLPLPRVSEAVATRLAGDIVFPEGLRWHRNRLVFSDMTDRQVLRVHPGTGERTVVAAVDHQPNGLGHLPDGRLLVASMLDARLLVMGPDGLVPYADLSALATGHLGDMVVDRAGGVYVGDVGARVLQGEAPRPGRLIRVDTDGSARVVQEGLHFPNGMAITPDGNTLLLAETLRSRVLQLRLHADGSVGAPRPFIAFDDDEGAPDGVCIDRQGGLWVCLPRRRAVQHYDKAGRLTGRVHTPDGLPIACALGKDEATLHVVGIAPLPPQRSIFAAIAARETQGWLASATLGPPP